MASPEATRVTSPSSSQRLRLHDQSSAAARHAIINSSHKGWSPLQINKRGGSASGTPLRPQDTGESASTTPTSNRRTSSSFRHMATNSLVANSPFKNLSTREGQLSNGIDQSPDRPVHERRTPNRALGQTPRSAQGSGNFSRSSIGLGISTSPTKGSALAGTRKVSSERKVSVPSSAERRSSGERKASRSKENESPENGSPKKKRVPRQSMAYKALVENEYVTHSPFLERPHNSTPPGDVDETEVMLGSPSPNRRISSGSRRRASPSAHLTQNRTSMSPSSSPRQTSNSTFANQPSPLREQVAVVEQALPVQTPTKSSLATPRRLQGPRMLGQASPTRKTVTFQNVPEVKEFDPPSAETSMNSSVDPVDDDEWTTDQEAEDVNWLGSVIRNEGERSIDSEEGVGDESATADFMDEIFGDEYAGGETPVFADSAKFEMPMESSPAPEDRSVKTPMYEYHELPVPDSPRHVHTVTPHLKPGKQPEIPHTDDHSMLLNADAHQPAIGSTRPESPGPHAHQDGAMYDPFLTIQTATEVVGASHERTEDGVPLGRTSHAERLYAARVLATQRIGLGYPGALPKQGPPVRGLRPDTDSDSDEGSNTSREAPPPLPPKDTTPPKQATPPQPESEDVFGAVIASPAVPTPRKISDRVVSDVPEFQGPSRRMAQFKRAKESTPKRTKEPATPGNEATPRRGLPRPPPPPAAIDVPSPVQMIPERQVSNSESEAESITSAGTASSGTTASDVSRAANDYLDMEYKLPSIGVSPLLAQESELEKAEDEPETRDVPDATEHRTHTRRVSDFAPKLEFSTELDHSFADLSIRDASPEVEEREPAPQPATRTRRVSDVAPRLELLSDLESSALDVEGDSHSGANLDVEGDSSSGASSGMPDTPDLAQGADDEPLTPPRRAPEVREESPRIPSFDLGDFSIDMPKDESEDSHASTDSAATVLGTPKPTTLVTAPSPSPAPSTPTRATPARATPSPSPGRASPSPATPSRMSLPSTPTRGTPSRATSPLASPPVTAPRTIASEFGPNLTNADASECSTNTRVRQRISREMIRENVSKRMAAEGLTNPRPHSMPSEGSLSSSQRSSNSGKVSFAPPSPAYARHQRGGSSSSIDKELPSRPDSATSLKSPLSPTSPRSPSALAHLAVNNSSKSALDRIATTFGDDSTPSSAATSPVADRVVSAERYVDSPKRTPQPVSILQRPDEGAPGIAPSVSGSIMSSGHDMASARKSRRRSSSLTDADPVRKPSIDHRGGKAKKKTPRVSLGFNPNGEFKLDSVRCDLDKIANDRGSYRVRENRHVIRATYTDGIHPSAGGLEGGSMRAWRPASQVDPELLAYEERAATASEAGHDNEPPKLVFVKILGLESLNLPLPSEATYAAVRLSNGLDTVLTPFEQLASRAQFQVEYCLTELEHSEFSLELEVRRDRHIAALQHALKHPEPAPSAVHTRLAPPPPPQQLRPESPMHSLTSRTGGGLRALFSSPRKNKHARTQSSMAAIPSQPPKPQSRPAAPPTPSKPKRETLANYMGGDEEKTLGRTHIAIEPIADQCMGKVLEIRYPMFSMFKNQPGPEGPTRKQVAKITIQILRLPALPGLSLDELPGSIDETLRGLRDYRWHQAVFNEGTLTQVGGDCRVPRRRLMRLVGANLHAINEVTRKEVASIDLAKAVALVDMNAQPKSPHDDDYDPYAARPRSFEVRFNDGESIVFSADKDDEKAAWMEILSDVVGRVPPNPLWARVFARMEEDAASVAAAETRRGRAASGASSTSRRSKVGPPRHASRSASGLRT